MQVSHLTMEALDVVGDASARLGEATIGKENTEFINRNLNRGLDLTTGLALGATALGVGAVSTSFFAASELGRGAIARAFKGAEVDALALRLVRGARNTHTRALFLSLSLSTYISGAL